MSETTKSAKFGFAECKSLEHESLSADFIKDEKRKIRDEKILLCFAVKMAGLQFFPPQSAEHRSEGLDDEKEFRRIFLPRQLLVRTSPR